MTRSVNTIRAKVRHPHSAHLLRPLAVASLLSLGASGAAWAAGECRVTPTGAGLADGSNWANAATLKGALALPGCSELWLKQGTYIPVSAQEWTDAGAGPSPAAAQKALRSTFFAVPRPLKLYGGFAGTETVLGNRASVDATLTILSGEIGKTTAVPTRFFLPGDTQANYDFAGTPQDNSFRIMVIGQDAAGIPTPGAFTTSTMVIDGVTFEGSHGDSIKEGALTCFAVNQQCGLTLNNAVIRNNTAQGASAGLQLNYNDGTTGVTDVLVTKSLFTDNWVRSGGYGGAIGPTQEATATTEPVKLVVQDSTFKGNYAYYGGGAIGMTAQHGALTIERSEFIQNQAAKAGAGAVHVECRLVTQNVPCNTEIKSSYFAENSSLAGARGGAVHFSAGTHTVTDSTFFKNSAPRAGFSMFPAGAITAGTNYSYDNQLNSHLKVLNSTFDGNFSERGAGAILLLMNRGDTVELNHSTFANNENLVEPRQTTSVGGGLIQIYSNLDYGQTATIEINNSIAWDNKPTDRPLITLSPGETGNYPAMAQLTIDNSVLPVTCNRLAAPVNLYPLGPIDYWFGDLDPNYSDPAEDPRTGIVTCPTMVNGDPKLQPLAVNPKTALASGAQRSLLKAGVLDKPLPTMLLGNGSSAFNTAVASAATTDQRGVARPQGAAPDMGAVEMRYAALDVAVTGNGQVTATGAAPASGTINSCDASANVATCAANYYVESAPSVQVALTATPAAGYSLVSWSGACASAGNATTANVTVAQATSCQASFAPTATAVLQASATAGLGGTVSPATQNAVAGDKVSFVLTPDTGYEVVTTAVGGSCAAGSWSGNTYTTGAVTQTCDVSFTFKKSGSTNPDGPGTGPGRSIPEPVPAIAPVGVVLLSGLVGLAGLLQRRRRQRIGSEVK